MFKPLVKEATRPQQWLIPYVAYALGTTGSGIALGTTLGAIGSAILPRQVWPHSLALSGIAGIALALCDLGVAGARTPTLHRQTDPVWWRTVGREGAMFLWGADIGLGFITIRVTSVYWMLALLSLLAPPFTGAVLLGLYGITLAISLGISTLLLGWGGYGSGIYVLRLHSLFKVGLAILLLSWGVLLLIAYR